MQLMDGIFKNPKACAAPYGLISYTVLSSVSVPCAGICESAYRLHGIHVWRR